MFQVQPKWTLLLYQKIIITMNYSRKTYAAYHYYRVQEQFCLNILWLKKSGAILKNILQPTCPQTKPGFMKPTTPAFLHPKIKNKVNMVSIFIHRWNNNNCFWFWISSFFPKRFTKSKHCLHIPCQNSLQTHELQEAVHFLNINI